MGRLFWKTQGKLVPFRDEGSGVVTGNTYGHGLGLAIAKRTMDAHRGTIRASNSNDGGLRVAISLPSRARH